MIAPSSVTLVCGSLMASYLSTSYSGRFHLYDKDMNTYGEKFYYVNQNFKLTVEKKSWSKKATMMAGLIGE